MTTQPSIPLTPAEVPGDFAELAHALVQTRRHSGAAVAVHDLRLAGRLVHLGLATVGQKGLRGTAALEDLLGRFGADVLAKTMCEDVPEAAKTKDSASFVDADAAPVLPAKSTPAPTPSSGPVPDSSPALANVSAQGQASISEPSPSAAVTNVSDKNPSAARSGSEPLSLSAFLVDRSKERSSAPSPAPTALTPAPSVQTGTGPDHEPERDASTSDAQDTVPTDLPTPSTPFSVLDESDLEALARARGMREEIGRLTRELQALLQPLAEKTMASAGLLELEAACALFPASLQRNALLAHMKTRAPG